MKKTLCALLLIVGLFCTSDIKASLEKQVQVVKEFQKVMQLIIPKAVPQVKKYLLTKYSETDLHTLSARMEAFLGIAKQEELSMKAMMLQANKVLNREFFDIHAMSDRHVANQYYRQLCEITSAEQMNSVQECFCTLGDSTKYKELEKSGNFVNENQDLFEMIKDTLTTSDDTRSIIDQYNIDLFHQPYFTYDCEFIQIPIFLETVFAVAQQSVNECIADINTIRNSLLQ